MCQFYQTILKEDKTMGLILKRQKKEELDTFSVQARLLVKALRSRDREEAYTLLIEQILPKKLAELPTYLDPSDYLETIVESLASDLEQARPNQRLTVLRAVLCDEEISQLDRDSIRMAVARYIKDHPEVTEIALNWLRSRDASKWLAMPRAELEAEAELRLEQLEKWKKFAKANHPSIWDNYRIEWLHIKLSFGAAKTGIFRTAMGSLAYFLHAVGADYDELRLF